MARFPQGLVLAAAVLELMILTVNSHAASVPSTSMNAQQLRVASDAGQATRSLKIMVAVASSDRLLNSDGASVLGLVRAEPPRDSKTSKQQKPRTEKTPQKSGQ
jgi:hypothetical protein